jgi:hypothetical protein
MSEDSPIAFALPSSVMTADAVFKDPRSLCTIFIVNTLKVAQDRIVQAFLNILGDLNSRPVPMNVEDGNAVGSATAAAAPGSRIVWGRSERAAGQSVALVCMIDGVLQCLTDFLCATDEYHVPVTTYQTPSPLVSRRLLYYDRETHLMPLVYMYSKQVSDCRIWRLYRCAWADHFQHISQDLSYGRGELLGYDFGRIEADLCFELMPTINPVAFAIEEFLFRVPHVTLCVLLAASSLHFARSLYRESFRTEEACCWCPKRSSKKSFPPRCSIRYCQD